MTLNQLAFALLLSTAVPASGPASTSAQPATAGQTRTAPASVQAHTPAKGSRERRFILSALRGVVKRMSGLDVVFEVKHLKVNGIWAWVDAEPRSADGSQHYEAMNGLLTRKSGRWIYLEGRPEWPVCEADPDCADSARYFNGLALKHPGLSPDIFPR